MTVKHFIGGILALFMVATAYFVATTIAAPATSPPPDLPELAYCPPDDSLGDWLIYDWSQSLSIPVRDDETLVWGLMSPDTNVFMGYAPLHQHVEDDHKLFADCAPIGYFTGEAPEAAPSDDTSDCGDDGIRTWHKTSMDAATQS